MEKASENRRRGKGGKLNRSEVVTIRLDPKLRYLTELAARQQRRTTSSFIEWAIEEGLESVYVDDRKTISLAEVAGALWDVDEARRFVNLAFQYPYLMTYEEQQLWELICKTSYLWRSKIDERGRFRRNRDKDSLMLRRLSQYWDVLKKVASGEEDKSILPRRPSRKVV